ncbi:hypothetical protein ACFY12_27440 [Streptomyces sp. NPDC001339]|uniref:hypothetical protein n=1 Tax=Streptomyces sp. NPDC001339 TaxID=3364563 RepID=UPI00369451A1
MVVLTGMILGIFAMQPFSLIHADHGSAFVFRTETVGGQGANEHRFLTWDVRKRAETSFRPEGLGRGFGFDGRTLRGELTFSTPRGCADRRIRWEISVDGDRVGSGSLRWLHTYTVKNDFVINRTPNAVALTMYWDGGDAACPSFSAEWKDARVERGPIG